jgi:hypothetical protein
VFYLARGTASQPLGETMLQIKSKTQSASLGIYNAPGAIAVRGTAQQIGQAAQLIQEQDN